MPISSFPISVRSSVNLSDINIDTDLDMGSNSIIGYTPSSSLSSLFKYFTYSCFYNFTYYFKVIIFA